MILFLLILVASKTSANDAYYSQSQSNGELYLGVYPNYFKYAGIAMAAGTTFTDAVCQEPASTSVGTVFRCTATDTEGVEWAFDVSIVDDSNFQITGRRQA